MSGEIKYNEDKIADALSKLGTLGEKLSSAKDVLNGIDTSGIELPALNIATVCGNIQNDIDGINAVIGEIMQIIAGMNIAENNNLDIIKGILLGAVNGAKYLIDNATTLSFLLQNDTSSQEIDAKFTSNGVELWKGNIKYNVKFESVFIEGSGTFRCFVMEPENPDDNIPTAFLLDGHGASAVSGISADNVIKSIESIGGAASVFGPAGDGYQQLMLTAINNCGLEKPNARFIYMPNNGPFWDARKADTFDAIVKKLANSYNIDTSNMTLIGHSSRRKSCCRICG